MDWTRIISLICIMIFLIGGCATKEEKLKSTHQIATLTEQEPNNNSEQANAISVAPVQITGYIGEQKDQDWFKITIPPDSSAILRAELDGVAELNLKMELMDSEQERLVEVDRQKEGEGEILTNYTLTQGDYFIRIRELWLANKERKFNDTLAYRMQVTFKPVKPNEETEPNDKGVLATALKPDVPMKGYLSPYDDFDWYKLELPRVTNQYLQITLSPLENVDTRLRIFDPIEALILEQNQGKTGEGEKIANLGIIPDYEFYYVVVQPRKWQTNETSQYELTVSFVQTHAKMEIEPNDRMVRATEIAVTDTVLGFLDSPEDEDWYALRGAGDELTVLRGEIVGVDKVDLAITVFDQNENQILYVNDTGELETEYICNLGLEIDVIYYIKISNLAESSNSTDAYEIKLAATHYYKDEEFESNNSFESASLIYPQKAMTGYVHPKEDVDFYQIDLRQYAEFNLSAKLKGIMKVNTDMALYDRDMKEIIKVSEKGPEESERIDRQLTSGIYYIKVYDKSGKQSNYRDKYELETLVTPL
ncbi:hypothetical protein JXJ21_22610 [candidate division KSB1 bacterium]|nr:hypothetical protein [candidate division KSB1 bacterium]